MKYRSTHQLTNSRIHQLFLCVFLDGPWSNLCAVNIAGRVDRHAFRRARAPEIGGVARLRIWNERRHLAVAQLADADAAPPIRTIRVHRPAPGVGDVEDVTLVYPRAARSAEH